MGINVVGDSEESVVLMLREKMKINVENCNNRTNGAKWVAVSRLLIEGSQECIGNQETGLVLNN